jgi:Fur family ferric uptake transcriptional regulator
VTTHQIDQQIRMRLAADEVRYTKGRRLVVDALREAEGPRSASELHEELERSVPLSSLYRSLSVMATAGVLHIHRAADGVARYELAEWLVGHHHHLVCIQCGAVDDVELADDQEAALRRLVAQTAGAGGYQVTGHSLEIDGLCAACA